MGGMERTDEYNVMNTVERSALEHGTHQAYHNLTVVHWNLALELCREAML